MKVDRPVNPNPPERPKKAVTGPVKAGVRPDMADDKVTLSSKAASSTPLPTAAAGPDAGRRVGVNNGPKGGEALAKYVRAERSTGASAAEAHIDRKLTAEGKARPERTDRK